VQQVGGPVLAPHPLRDPLEGKLVEIPEQQQPVLDDEFFLGGRGDIIALLNHVLELVLALV